MVHIVNVQSLLSFAAAGVAVNTYNTHVATSPSESHLKLCKRDLDEVKGRVNELTPRQCEEIDVLTEQGKCKSIEIIEQDMRKLVFYS